MDMFGNRSRTLILALLLGCVLPIRAAQLYYSPISINSAQVPSTQTDFPVLVSQTDNRFRTVGNGGHVNNSNGYDIRPYSDAALTTALTYELERYNASTGEVVMWVKVASLSSSTTPIYLGYGDTSLTTDGSSTATWSNNFWAVYHWKDGSTLSSADSTSNGQTLTNTNTPTATTGQIDGGINYASASTQYSATGGSVALTAAMSFSAWVKGTTFPNAYNTMWGYNSTAGGTKQFMCFVKSTGKLAVYVQTGASTVSYDGTGSNTLSTGTWYHIAVTYNSGGGGLNGYVNGGSDKQVNAGFALTTASVPVYISNDPITSGRNWNGPMDELHISSVERSADWTTTEYNNGKPATFETLGAEAVPGAGSGKWFMFLKK